MNQQTAISKAQQYGKNLLENLEKTTITPKSFASKNLKWQFIQKVDRYNNKINKDIVKTAFMLTPPNNSISSALSMKGISLKTGDYALVRLIAVHDEKYPLTSNSMPNLYREEVANSFGQLEYALYRNNLLKKSSIN